MGRLDDLIGEITKPELIHERGLLIAERQRLDRKIAAIEGLIAVKDEEPDLPPLHAAIVHLFKAKPGPRDTDDVTSELQELGWLGDRSKASVNATLGRLVNEGELHRPNRGYYDLGPAEGNASHAERVSEGGSAADIVFGTGDTVTAVEMKSQGGEWIRRGAAAKATEDDSDIPF